jgi:hypothetical protein
LDPDHASTEMLLAYERYAAPLIFLGGRVYQNELLAWRHFCLKRDESAAEVQPTDVGFLPKWFLVIPTAVNQNRQILWEVQHWLRIVEGRNSSSECKTAKAVTAAFTWKGRANKKRSRTTSMRLLLCDWRTSILPQDGQCLSIIH